MYGLHAGTALPGPGAARIRSCNVYAVCAIACATLRDPVAAASLRAGGTARRALLSRVQTGLFGYRLCRARFRRVIRGPVASQVVRTCKNVSSRDVGYPRRCAMNNIIYIVGANPHDAPTMRIRSVLARA